ncbi:MAG: CBS domain-containing protein [Candidatus Woesearchaeota archaeon]
MSKPVKKISKDLTIREAVKIMDENNIGILPVVENEKPIGVITERDILRRVVAKNENLDNKVETIMTKNPITIEHDATILEATRLMSENGFRHLLVLKAGKLVGIVTAKDVIEVLSA